MIVLLIRPLAMLFGALLQSAISRQREYAADAVAVRLCSYNEGLASALEKLSRERQYSAEDIEALGTKQLAPMYLSRVCPMDCSMPGFPALPYLPEFAQTHVH